MLAPLQAPAKEQEKKKKEWKEKNTNVQLKDSPVALDPLVLPRREQLAEKFPTAALAVIDFAAGPWSGLRPGTGALDRFITPLAVSGDGD